jgi:hypothetical protein
MNFNSHYDLVGKHAFLSASNYHWINYDPEKLDVVYRNMQAARRGTELHAFAHEAVRLGIKLPRTTKTLNMYVNDCIGFRMTTEQILYYSDNAYGTCDAISYRKQQLKIFDLKTGQIDASFHQLEVYVALFCLEYGIKPGELETELRIYQHDEVDILVPDVETIAAIMDKIIVFDRRIELIKSEG